MILIPITLTAHTKIELFKEIKMFYYQAGHLQLKKLDFRHVSALRGKLGMQSLGPENKL